MKDTFPIQGGLKWSAGLALSIIATILSVGLFIILFWAIPHAQTEAPAPPAGAAAPPAGAAASAKAETIAPAAAV